MQPHRVASIVEVTGAEPGCSRGPGSCVSVPSVCARLRAEGDELGEVVHRLHVAGRRDVDEPLCVEVVTQEERRIRVGCCEEPGAAVVNEIPLVDRLHAERQLRRRERGEHGLGASRLERQEGIGPERALPSRLLDDRVPHARRRYPERLAARGGSSFRRFQLHLDRDIG